MQVANHSRPNRLPSAGAWMLIANKTEAARLGADRAGRFLPIVALGVVGLFLLAPWPFPVKAHAALHGLCAQRPSHSLQLGEQVLPFDARMTGIYGGCFVAFCYLVTLRRLRASRMPPPAVLATLAFFVGVMALDGLNSLLADLGLWHPYEPANHLRLATGLLTGVALAVALCFLLAATLWRAPNLRQAPVAGPRELLLLVVLQGPYALLVGSGIPALYAPVTTLLLVAAVTVVMALIQVLVLLLGHRDRTFDSFRQLQVPASVALLLAVGVMAAIAAGRYLLEHLTGAPPLT